MKKHNIESHDVICMIMAKSVKKLKKCIKRLKRL